MFKYLLSFIIIPHGITDIIVSYETNTIYEMSLLYLLAPFTFIHMNKSLYRLYFILFSWIHFNNHKYTSFIPFNIGLNYYSGITDYNDSFKYITYYLSLIHTPQHYYDIFSSTNYIYEHLYIIFITTFVSIIISPPIINWIQIHSGEDNISKYIGGIIISHILYNEYLLIHQKYI